MSVKGQAMCDQAICEQLELNASRDRILIGEKFKRGNCN